MQIDIKVAPEPLSTNLLHLAMALPLAVAIGVVQWGVTDSPAWWHAVYADLRSFHYSEVLIGICAGVALLLMSTLIGTLCRGLRVDWVYKALAAIPPSGRSIWLLSMFAATFEEILFRAALTPIVGIVSGALVFAAAHIGVLLFAPSKAAAALVFADLLLFGLVMGLLFEAAGLVACIVAHLVHNVLGFYIGRQVWAEAHETWRSDHERA